MIKLLLTKLKNWSCDILDSIKIPVPGEKYVVLKDYYSLSHSKLQYKDEDDTQAPERLYPASTLKCFIIKRGLFSSWVVKEPFGYRRLVENKYLFDTEFAAKNYAESIGKVVKPITLKTLYLSTDEIPTFTEEEIKEVKRLENKISKRRVNKAKTAVRNKKQTNKNKVTSKK